MISFRRPFNSAVTDFRGNDFCYSFRNKEDVQGVLYVGYLADFDSMDIRDLQRFVKMLRRLYQMQA